MITPSANLRSALLNEWEEAQRLAIAVRGVTGPVQGQDLARRLEEQSVTLVGLMGATLMGDLREVLDGALADAQVVIEGMESAIRVAQVDGWMPMWDSAALQQRSRLLAQRLRVLMSWNDHTNPVDVAAAVVTA